MISRSINRPILINGKPQWQEEETRFWRMARNVREDHMKRGFRNEIAMSELADIIRKGFENGCKYCKSGLVLNNSYDGHKCNSITVDIIDPNRRVLSKDNIQIICYCCNQAKGRMSEEEFKNVKWY
jgi:hypothetical protein